MAAAGCKLWPPDHGAESQALWRLIPTLDNVGGSARMFPAEIALQNSELRQAHSRAGLFASRHFNYSMNWQRESQGQAERT